MHEVDERDRVEQLKDVPQSDIGAPNPFVVSSEHGVAVAYYLSEPIAGWDGTTVRVVGPDSEDLPVAIVTFPRCYARMFGPPNDEAFQGHPLASRGLRPHGSFIVRNSSWVRRLERMNAVHPCHDQQRFLQWNHFVLAFHDRTFECVAEWYGVTKMRGSVHAAVPNMVDLLR